jgi:outer membrane beta-barrel protein
MFSSLRWTVMGAVLLPGAAALAVPGWSMTPSAVLAQAGATPEDDDEPARLPDTSPAVSPPDAGVATAPGTTATATPEQMELVNGAPLFNPNVGVHIIEQKRFSDSGRFEVTLYPVVPQVNGRFTQHVGSMGQVTYHLQENFGLMVMGGGNWFNDESSLNRELVEKAGVEAQAASSLLWTWGVMGGVEVTPFYGKFALFEGTLAQFGFVITGGVGLGGSRHQLRPENTRDDGTVTRGSFGDTGVRFMAALGAGFRLQVGSRFAVRLEVRDVVSTARVEQVNGCTVDDLTALDAADKAGRPLSSAMVATSCRVGTFDGVDPETGVSRRRDLPLARGLVRTPSSDVLHNVGLYLGFSVLF